MTRSPRARPSRTKGIRAPAASSGPSKRAQTCRCLPRSAAAKRIAAECSRMWPTLPRQDRSVYLVYSWVSMSGSAEDQQGTRHSATEGLLADQMLRSLPDCRPETVEILVKSARLRRLPPGEQIYQQGEPVPLTLILRGFGAFRRTTMTGQEFLSGVAPAGALFGWLGIATVPSG